MYESYFAQVQASNPPQKTHPYFERLIRPLLERQGGEINGDIEGEMGLDEELKEMKGEKKDGPEEVRREDSWHDSKDE